MVTLARVVKAEWIKFRTLRSSWLTLGAAVALMVIVGLIHRLHHLDTANWGATPRGHASKRRSSPLRRSAAS